MKIVTLGRGDVSCGLAASDALGRVTAQAGKLAIDATNAFPSRNQAFPSLAAEVKSVIGSPVAESFNLNFAVLYDQIAAQRCGPAAYTPPTTRSPSGSPPTPATTRSRSAAWTRPAPLRT